MHTVPLRRLPATTLGLVGTLSLLTPAASQASAAEACPA